MDEVSIKAEACGVVKHTGRVRNIQICYEIDQPTEAQRLEDLSPQSMSPISSNVALPAGNHATHTI